jgi:phage terminase large subunit-like protein
MSPALATNSSPRSWAEQFKSLPRSEFDKYIAQLSDDEAETVLHDWDFWARPNQLIPPGDWTNWLVLAGRGWGKTKTGSETVRRWVKDCPLVNLVGPTAADVRDVMVQGIGVGAAIMEVCRADERPVYEKSNRRLVWPNGAISLLFSAEEPERLRGPQHKKLWADELAAWKYPNEAWEQIDFGLRLGANPQTVITTTPKPTKLIKYLAKSPETFLTGGSTYDNRANLAPKFFNKIITKYEGTRLGRQELNAELLEDRPGALWTLAGIDKDRVKHCPPLVRIVIAVDPAVTSGEDSAEWGIVAAGQGPSPAGVDWPPHYYVFKDLSLKASPEQAALVIVGAYQAHKADRIVAEVNNGGDLVEAILRTKSLEFAYSAVHASRGKLTRAEPIAALYEQHRVHHVGAFPILEDQQADYVPFVSKSPDRMDALVWGLSDLSGENEQEVIYEHTELQSIAPDLDEADFRQF